MIRIMRKEKIYKELYVLVFKETGEIVTPDSFKKYWKNYGSVGNSLGGWRPPKKIYYTLGTAKSGFNYIPEQIKSQIGIALFAQQSIVVDGIELADKQKMAAEKRRKEDEIRRNQYCLEQAKLKLEEAQNELKRLQGKE